MAEHPHAILKESGFLAVIEPDRWVSGGFMLVVDGTPQSHVNTEDPGQLSFEYVARIGHVIDQLGMPGEPITAIHLGAGALTLPRYVHATRPGSRQQVIELERELVDLVRSEMPLPRDAGIRIRYGDARAVLGRLPAGLTGTADLVVVDIFSGARTPAHVTSVEFYREAATLLAPTGVMAVNIADGPGLRFARSQAATLVAALEDVAVLAETQVLKGRRFGNVVIIGAPAIQSRSSRPETTFDGCGCADNNRCNGRAVAAAIQEHLSAPPWRERELSSTPSHSRSYPEPDSSAHVAGIRRPRELASMRG